MFTGEPVEFELRGGLIHRVSPLPRAGQAEDLPYLGPALLDLQVGGCARHGGSLPGDGLAPIVRRLEASGTARHVVTLLTAPRERLVRGLRALSRTLRASPEAAAAVAGVHVEGPFISAEDGPRGRHVAAWVRPPDFEEFREWQEAAEGRIRLITLAPELPGALCFIERLTAAGVIAAIGHTAAEPGRIHEAVRAGARLSTHLGNGAHSLRPRLPDYVWQQLGEDDLTAALICDGAHLPPEVVRVFARAKGLERLVLVSGAGVADSRVEDSGAPSAPLVAAGAHRALEDRLLDWDVAHFLAYTGCGLGEAVGLCTHHPAALLGLPAGDGELAAGSPAHLVQFRYRPGDLRLEVLRTFRGGRVVFEAGEPADAGA